MNNETDLLKILNRLSNNEISVNDAELAVKDIITNTATLENAIIDNNREFRTGFPEAIFAESKTEQQVLKIFNKMLTETGKALATRCNSTTLKLLKQNIKNINIDYNAKIAWLNNNLIVKNGKVAVITAGTSDIKIAEEAAITLEFSGFKANRIYDIGVAGIHRFFNRINIMEKCDVVIVAAGMEGALPSVAGGLISKPIIAVPTSIGYGASFSGVSALLGMLNSCSAGITVVNIDNGFGAAVAAVRILNNIRQKGD